MYSLQGGMSSAELLMITLLACEVKLLLICEIKRIDVKLQRSASHCRGGWAYLQTIQGVCGSSEHNVIWMVKDRIQLEAQPSQEVPLEEGRTSHYHQPAPGLVGWV